MWRGAALLQPQHVNPLKPGKPGKLWRFAFQNRQNAVI